MKAFGQAKARALAKLRDVSATKVTLPFVEEQLLAARMLMGEDFWAYGLDPTATCWRRSCGGTMRKGCHRGC